MTARKRKPPTDTTPIVINLRDPDAAAKVAAADAIPDSVGFYLGAHRSNGKYRVLLSLPSGGPEPGTTVALLPEHATHLGTMLQRYAFALEHAKSDAEAVAAMNAIMRDMTS